MVNYLGCIDSMRPMMKSAVLVVIFTASLFLPVFTDNVASEEVSDIEVIFTAVNPENNNTYHLLSEASWSESAQVARGLDGYLVTINDELENQWLMDTFAVMTDNPDISGLAYQIIKKKDYTNGTMVHLFFTEIGEQTNRPQMEKKITSTLLEPTWVT